MTKSVLLGACLSAALATAACQDQTTAPTANSARTGTTFASAATVGRPALDRASVQPPASGRLTSEGFADVILRAINPNDYICPPSTPVIDWYLGKVNETIEQEPATFDLLYNQLLADLIPTYEALYFQTTDTPQYFGYDGEYTTLMRKTERNVKRFWDIQSSDIQVLGMHGSMLLDVDRSAATYEFLFGLDPATATFFATLVRDAVAESQTLNGGNHPLFSFNAFAFSDFGGPLADKIVMGDGMLAGYEAMGFGDVALPAVFAHEFAHHIQYENDYFGDPYATTGSSAERTRYTELMADAMSAYYLTHKHGGTMNQKRVAQFLDAFFQIGDCAFTNPGHHGTPNQRMRAAEFGFRLADEAQKQGHILTSAEVHARFVAEYPTIITPDAT